MKVCVVGYGYNAEKNVELFSVKHIVALFVPIPIPLDESMTLRERIQQPIYYEVSSVADYDVFVVCLQLKYDHIEQAVDTVPVSDTISTLRRGVRKGCTVIIETTGGVGVTRNLLSGMQFHGAYSPVVFDPNSVSIKVTDIPKLVGGLDVESELLAKQFYDTVYSNVVMTGSPEVAEAAVLLKSTQTTIEEAVINEFADFCDSKSIDIHSVIDAATVGTRDARTVLPWVGRAVDIDSQLLMGKRPWPVLSTASSQLMARPAKVYKSIVNKYCAGDFEKLRKMTFLVVGLGAVRGSTDMENSPVLDIVRYLELEGATVTKYDMLIEEYSTTPSVVDDFDGILVMHPYNVSVWEQYEQTTFYCRH
jgi:UDP-N-acetyl-D-glucosamine dehydrogenase